MGGKGGSQSRGEEKRGGEKEQDRGRDREGLIHTTVWRSGESPVCWVSQQAALVVNH